MPNAPSSFPRSRPLPGNGTGLLSGSEAKAEAKIDSSAVSVYLECAQDSIKSGKDCSNLEKVALAAGMDPTLVKAYKECVKGSTDSCSKFAVTTAATKACEAYTAGAGAAVCTGAVPVVVDLVWPVVGPVANVITGGVKSVVAGFGSALSDIGKEFASMFGFGKSKDTDLGLYRANLQTAANWGLVDATEKALDGFEKITLETRKQLSLPEQGIVTWPDGIGRNPRNATNVLLQEDLRGDNPLYSGTFEVLGRSPAIFKLPPVRYWAIGLNDWMSLGFKRADWTPTKLTWLGELKDGISSNNGKGYDKAAVLFSMEDAMRQILIFRMAGIQATVPKTIGKTIAYVTKDKAKADAKNESGALTWLLTAAILGGAAYGGYKWYKK